MAPAERAALAFVVAVALALALTPLTARLAARLGLVDRPGGRRRHEAVVPFGGGVAIAVAIAVPVLAWARPLDDQHVAILLGGLGCLVLGLADDRFDLAVGLKLAGQVAVALVPVSAGVQLDHLTLPILDPVQVGALGAPLTVIWIVALMNVLNFIDGMDGLAGGFTAIAAVTFAILSLSLDRVAEAVIAASMAGACVGFLRHNFHPARVFMGDAGAMLLGFMLATVSVQGVLKTAAAVAVAFPLLVLFVPIADTSFVVLKRLKYGRAPWEADRNHLHHRFGQIGWSQRRAALLLYAWVASLCAFALTVRFVHYRTHGDWHVGATLLLSGMALLALAFTGYVVYVLEIVKLRHLHMLGLGRGSEVAGETPLIEARRLRRRRRSSPAPRA